MTLQSAALGRKELFLHISILPYTNLQSVKVTLMLYFHGKFRNTCYIPEVQDTACVFDEDLFSLCTYMLSDLLNLIKM